MVLDEITRITVVCARKHAKDKEGLQTQYQTCLVIS